MLVARNQPGRVKMRDLHRSVLTLEGETGGQADKQSFENPQYLQSVVGGL